MVVCAKCGEEYDAATNTGYFNCPYCYPHIPGASDDAAAYTGWHICDKCGIHLPPAILNCMYCYPHIPGAPDDTTSNTGRHRVCDNDKTSHDAHYRRMRVQPVDVQEQFLAKNTAMPRGPSHHIATAIQYLMRAGLKNDVGAIIGWQQDIEKASNHLYRALHGRWPWEVPND